MNMRSLPVITVNEATRDLKDIALRVPSRAITQADLGLPWFRSLVQTMFETLYNSGVGIGLAAPQIGVLVQVAVIDLKDGSEPMVLINPSYEAADETLVTRDEECLSVPHFTAPVERPGRVRVKCLDLHGNTLEFEKSGFLARVIQHETDHLKGMLYLDRPKVADGVRSYPGGRAAVHAGQTTDKLFSE